MPHDLIWIATFAVGAIMIGIYFWPRFDDPNSDIQSGCYARYSPRYLTSPYLYMRAKWSYISVILSAYIIFSFVPKLLAGLAEVALNPQLGNIASLGNPLAIALAILALQNFPILKDLEPRIRCFLYRFAQIPEAMRATRNLIQPLAVTCQQTTIDLLTQRMGATQTGVTQNLISKDELLSSWYSMGCLLTSLGEKNRESLGIDLRFFDDNSDEFESTANKHAELGESMRHRLDSVLNNAPLPATAEDSALLRELGLVRQRLYTFIACALQYSAKSADDRSEILARLGFDGIHFDAARNRTLGPIIGLSFISVMIVSIIPVFFTQYFLDSFLASLPAPWSGAFAVPTDALRIYLWSWTTAFFYGAAITGALAVRDARIRKRAWFNINDITRQRPIINYVTPVIVGTSAGCIMLFIIALIDAPGLDLSGKGLGAAVISAVQETLPWYPLAFVMAFLALWLVDSNMSAPQSRRSAVLAKVALAGLAGGFVMGLAGCLTSYISLSSTVSDVAKSNDLPIPTFIAAAVRYVSVFIAALIAFFSTVLYFIVQVSTIYRDGTQTLAGKWLRGLKDGFTVLLDPAGHAAFYESADATLDQAKERSRGRWIQFPEGTVVRWSDSIRIGQSYAGTAGLISASNRIRYEGFNGYISGKAPFTADLEVRDSVDS